LLWHCILNTTFGQTYNAFGINIIMTNEKRSCCYLMGCYINHTLSHKRQTVYNCRKLHKMFTTKMYKTSNTSTSRTTKFISGINTNSGHFLPTFPHKWYSVPMENGQPNKITNPGWYSLPAVISTMAQITNLLLSYKTWGQIFKTS